MQDQPKPKTESQSRFDRQAKEQTEKNVKESKARDAKQNINGYPRHHCDTGECAGYCGDCG